MKFEERLQEYFIDLPEPTEETESFVHVSRSGKLLFVSGQLPYDDSGRMYRGRVGMELNLDTAKTAAKAAGIQVLGTVKSELGSVDKIKRIVKMTLYIATGTEFKDHKKVLGALQDFYTEIFGAFGKAAAEIVGCASLPEGAAVQLSVLIEMG